MLLIEEKTQVSFPNPVLLAFTSCLSLSPTFHSLHQQTCVPNLAQHLFL